MKALTLKHPWAFSIAHWGKRIENRSWKPPAALIGQRIAIHGGAVPKGRHLTSAQVMVDELIGLHGIAKFSQGMTRASLMQHAIYESSGICATAVIDRWVEYQEWNPRGFIDPMQLDPWFDQRPENFGWVLRDVVTLEKPVPCKGAQGLWNLPDDVLAQVTQQGAT